MYEIILYRRSASFYDELDKKQQKRLDETIDGLRNNPFYGKDIKKLKGKLRGKYRLRVGSLRVVYVIDKRKNLMIIQSIGPRESIY